MRLFMDHGAAHIAFKCQLLCVVLGHLPLVRALLCVGDTQEMQSNCTACSTGMYYDNTTDACTQCAPGRYDADFDVESPCTACPVGQLVDQLTWERCNPCPPGQMKDVTYKFGTPAWNVTDYKWVDIRSTGTKLTAALWQSPIGGWDHQLGDDDGIFQIDFQFPFYYWGRLVKTVVVTTNGFAVFHNDPGTFDFNADFLGPMCSFPTGSDDRKGSSSGGKCSPFAIIMKAAFAAYWTDLYPGKTSANGGVFYLATEAKIIVSFVEVPFYTADSTDHSNTTFQYILSRDGSMTFQYKRAGIPKEPSPHHGLSIGYQDWTGLIGVQIGPLAVSGRELKKLKLPDAESAYVVNNRPMMLDTSACAPCAVGTYDHDALGATKCESCPAGRLSTEEGATECSECTPGRFTGDGGIISKGRPAAQARCPLS